MMDESQEWPDEWFEPPEKESDLSQHAGVHTREDGVLYVHAGNPFFVLPHHDHAQELVDMISTPDALELKTLTEIHAIFSDAGYQEIDSGDVSMGWNNQRTCAMLITRDCKAIAITIGPDGTYGISILFKDITKTSRKDCAQWRTYEQELSAALAAYYRGKTFQAFIDQVVYASDE